MNPSTLQPFVPSRTASVADQLAFDRLPDETRALVERIYGEVPAPDGKWVTADELEPLYEEAYEAGQESVELDPQSLSQRELQRAVKDFITGRKG